MAEKNTSASRDLIDDGTNIIISKQRNELAITAAAEIEELSNLMQVASKTSCDFELSIRGLSMRVKDLSTIIMGALGDESENVQELAHRLTGKLTAQVAA